MLADESRAVTKFPETLPGFDRINRYWDRTRDSVAAKILPGEYYVTRNDEFIATVLGSCVAACVYDPLARIGGMNHFMLPTGGDHEVDSWRSADPSASTRYGNFAMEHLINDVLKHGGARQRLQVKVFGGGRVLAQMTDVGKRNIAFVEDYIQTEGLNVTARDLGDVYPRKVVFHPLTGKVMVKKLITMHNSTVTEREAAYLQELKSRPVSGDVELFD
jgi:chemotaxis protein CheD